MGIRDIAIFLVVAIGIPFILRNPAVGIGYWVWLSLMNPHRGPGALLTLFLLHSWSLSQPSSGFS